MGNAGSGKMLGSNAPSTNSMEANIRRMNATNANKNNMSGGPKTMGTFIKFSLSIASLSLPHVGLKISPS